MATSNDDEFNPPDATSPGPASPSGQGISGFTGNLGASVPQGNVPLVPSAAFFGASAPGTPVGAPAFRGPSGPSGTPTSGLSGQAFAAQQIGSLDARKAITANEAENLASGQQSVSDINAAAASNFTDQQASQKTAWEAAQAQVDARDAELKKAVQEAHAEKVDPNRLWNSKSTGGKVLAGIAVALGAAGAGLLHSGTNGAMTILQSAIDADIDSQKANIANNWKAVQEKHGLDNDTFNRAMHDQTWRSNFQTAGLENVKLQLLSAAAKTSSQSVKDNAAIAIKDIEDKQGAIRNGLYQSQMAASAAGNAKAEKLAGEARGKVFDLIKDGMSPEDAQKTVDGQYGMLRGTAYASTGQKAEQRNELVAQNLARQLLVQDPGLKPEEALKNARDQVNKASPAYGAAGDSPKIITKEQRAASAGFESDLAGLKQFRDPEMLRKIAPSLVEGLSEGSRKDVSQAQDAYRDYVETQVMKMEKLITGENIKNPEIVAKKSQKYLPQGAYEDPEITATRISHLERDIRQAQAGVLGKVDSGGTASKSSYAKTSGSHDSAPAKNFAPIGQVPAAGTRTVAPGASSTPVPAPPMGLTAPDFSKEARAWLQQPNR